jgi:hypothetical protein
MIYDRFPLIDGTLFMSPISYGSKKSVPIKSSFPKTSTHHKLPNDSIQKDNHQFINGICLKCLTGEKDHEITCKHCSTTWQSKGGSNLQIGTLYKYDIFAAFPCCQPRLNCSKCSSQITSIELASYEYFSSYSEEKECKNCLSKAYHYAKPLSEIYLKSKCQKS